MLLSIYSIFYFVSWYVAGLVDQTKLIEYNMIDDFYYCQKWRHELFNRDAKITYYVKPNRENWLNHIKCYAIVNIRKPKSMKHGPLIYTQITNNPKFKRVTGIVINPSIPVSGLMELLKPIKKQATLFEWASKYNYDSEFINYLDE